MEKYVVKVGTCATSGKLLMKQSAFDEQYASAYAEISDMSKGLERILFERALEWLSSLCGSEDECVCGKCVVRLSVIRTLGRESKKKNKVRI